jgi:hypothetical protein
MPLASSSIILNRVVGNEASVLSGGFIASTPNLTNMDFNAGNYAFKSAGG